MTIPIIRLEIEGFKHTLMMALSEHSAKMNYDLKQAVSNFCTPENIANIVQEAAKKQLQEVIQEEVQSFFKYGEGRRAVKEAVRESLLKVKSIPLGEETYEQD